MRPTACDRIDCTPMRKHLAYLALAALLPVSCITEKNPPLATEYVTVGTACPPFVVSGADGLRFEAPKDFAGRTTLLVFFATWCPDCQAELPAINAVWSSVAQEPVYNVVAVSRGGAKGRYEQNPDILDRYWSEHDLQMPCYLDGDRSVYDRFASAGIPRVYIVNDTGTVVWQAAAPRLDAADYLALLRQYR